MAKARNKGILIKATVVVIILFIVFLLFSNGVFTTQLPLAPCTPFSQFTCASSDVQMNTNGRISFDFAQATGTTIYNVSFLCIIGKSNYSAVKNFAFMQIKGASNFTNGSGLKHIENLSCYENSGQLLNAVSIGTSFNNIVIWLKYTSQNQTAIVPVLLINVTVT